MYEKNERVKTNSLTHLTKILIKETMESDLKSIYNRLCRLETHNETKETIIDATEILNNIKNKLGNCGGPWNQNENDLYF